MQVEGSCVTMAEKPLFALNGTWVEALSVEIPKDLYFGYPTPRESTHADVGNNCSFSNENENVLEIPLSPRPRESEEIVANNYAYLVCKQNGVTPMDSATEESPKSAKRCRGSKGSKRQRAISQSPTVTAKLQKTAVVDLVQEAPLRDRSRRCIKRPARYDDGPSEPSQQSIESPIPQIGRCIKRQRGGVAHRQLEERISLPTEVLRVFPHLPGVNYAAPKRKGAPCRGKKVIQFLDMAALETVAGAIPCFTDQVATITGMAIARCNPEFMCGLEPSLAGDALEMAMARYVEALGEPDKPVLTLDHHTLVVEDICNKFKDKAQSMANCYTKLELVEGIKKGFFSKPEGLDTVKSFLTSHGRPLTKPATTPVEDGATLPAQPASKVPSRRVKEEMEVRQQEAVDKIVEGEGDVDKGIRYILLQLKQVFEAKQKSEPLEQLMTTDSGHDEEAIRQSLLFNKAKRKAFKILGKDSHVFVPRILEWMLRQQCPSDTTERQLAQPAAIGALSRTAALNISEVVKEKWVA